VGGDGEEAPGEELKEPVTEYHLSVTRDPMDVVSAKLQALTT
jgi:hypothetical protein